MFLTALLQFLLVCFFNREKKCKRDAKITANMITRRRGRAAAAAEEQLLESEGGNTVTIDSPSERFPADDTDTDTAQMELEDLFGFGELAWMLERDPAPTLADLELDDLAACGAQGQDSGTDASMGSSPLRPSSGVKANKKNLSSFVGNKNAIAARLNRLKKKEYVSSLEKKVSLLSSENGGLKRENSELTKRVEELEDETRYLRAVLANESMLAQLLSRLSGVNGMKLSSSLFQGCEANEHDYALPGKRVKVEEKERAGGVCLHVDRDHVSVEFCTKCAQRASAAFKM